MFISTSRISRIGLVVVVLLVLGAVFPTRSASAWEFDASWGTSTIYLNKAETKDWALPEAALGACFAVLEAFKHPALTAVCFRELVPFAFQAKRAENRGMCLKIKFVTANPGVHWPDIYNGPRCH